MDRLRTWWTPARLISWMAMGFILFRLVDTAWICDDAYITFRTVDNVVHGYGATWNVAERVQAYTHPLWMLLHVPLEALFGNIYWVSMVLSFAFSLGTALLVLRRAGDRLWGAAFLAMLAFSPAYVDYSTSGLENPLTHFLLALFAIRWLDGPTGNRQLLHLSLIGALMAMNRMDSVLLVAPVLAWLCWQQRSWAAIKMLALGLSPFLAWELFSIVYYGFPFPNTAYAKLGAGQDLGARFMKGLAYYGYSLRRMDIGFLILLLALVRGLLEAHRRNRLLLAGGALYLVYILWIGGDFMGGRFFTSVMAMAVISLADWEPPVSRRMLLFPAALVLLMCVRQFRGGFAPQPAAEAVDSSGVADERSFYYADLGMLPVLQGVSPDAHRWAQLGLRYREKAAEGGPSVQYGLNMGLTGYHAGPGVHLVDRYGLTDPLLARLPAVYLGDWRPGHYLRLIPPGYVNGLKNNANHISNPEIAGVWDELQVITRGPLFSGERWKLMWKFWWGASPGEPERFALPLTRRMKLLDAEERDSVVVPLGVTEGLLLEAEGEIPWFSMELLLEARGWWICHLRHGEEVLQTCAVFRQHLGKETTTLKWRQDSFPGPAPDNVLIYPVNAWGSFEFRGWR